MSPPATPAEADEMRPEYDFSHGVRAKHYEAYRAGTNVVFRESDLVEAFPDSAAVNHAFGCLSGWRTRRCFLQVGLPGRCSRRAAPEAKPSRNAIQARHAGERPDVQRHGVYARLVHGARHADLTVRGQYRGGRYRLSPNPFRGDMPWHR